ncbi:hypothetical protein HZS_1948 [Henneguya salminicola]|nr:hypothetical protein HZS_1948 [Henneguya salminicola]
MFSSCNFNYRDIATSFVFFSHSNPARLNLSDNRIRDGLENLSCPKLEQLKMSNNKVSTLDSLKPLTTLGCLKSVDLFNCPVCDIEEYRNSVFQMLPTLKILDGADVNGEEVDSSDDEEENDDDENDYSADSLSEEEVGLDYLKRNDLEDDEEDVTFEANGHEASEDEEEDSEESSVDNAEDSLLNESSHKRSHSDAFEPEDGSQDQKKK